MDKILPALLVAAFAALGAFGYVLMRPHPEPPPELRDAANDRVMAAALEDCPDARAPQPLEGVLRLRLFHEQGVEAARMREVESAARRYWGRHGLRVELAAVEPFEHASMFGGTFAELEGKKGEALTQALYGDVRAFIEAQAQPAREEINVVVVRDIVHPSAAAAAVIGDLMGLTLAPVLLRDGSERSTTILAGLGLDAGEEFEATVMLSDRHLTRLGAEAFVAAVAHELGHALGLRHVERATNLMAEKRAECLPDLDDTQAEQLQSSLAQ